MLTVGPAAEGLPARAHGQPAAERPEHVGGGLGQGEEEQPQGDEEAR